jgi:tRNA(Ile)-lysidine synthase TilS/MesJ
MKILSAMSGGVDSSVATALLVREGHEVVGAYMKNWINEENIIGHCPWEEDIVDARAVADQLGIELHIVNLMKEYRERVVKYLLEGYQDGITPNPDVMCNREMKFGVLWDWARERGFDAIATGHYARMQDGRLLRGLDPGKDQTYFLHTVPGAMLARTLFPIGELPKDEVRRLAHEQARAVFTSPVPDIPAMTAALTVANAPEAQAAGVSTTFVWRVKRIIPDMLPREYWVPSDALIAAEAARQGDRGDDPPVIPGVVFEREAQVTGRRK